MAEQLEVRVTCLLHGGDKIRWLDNQMNWICTDDACLVLRGPQASVKALRAACNQIGTKGAYDQVPVLNRAADIIVSMKINADLTRKKIDTLFEAIKHGDEAHQAWLKKAIEDHFGIR